MPEHQTTTPQPTAADFSALADELVGGMAAQAFDDMEKSMPMPRVRDMTLEEMAQGAGQTALESTPPPETPAAPVVEQPQPEPEKPSPPPIVPSADPALVEQNALLKSVVQTLLQRQPPAPVAPAQERPDPLVTFAEKHAIDVSDFRHAVDAIVEDRLRPATEMQEAETRFLQQFPEAKANAEAVQTFVQQHPEVGADVDALWKKGLYEQGMKYAYTAYKSAQPAPVPAPAVPSAPTVEVIEQQRVQAASVSRGGGGPTHTPAVQEGKVIPREEFDKLRAASYAGYDTPLIRRIFTPDLPDEIPLRGFGGSV